MNENVALIINTACLDPMASARGNVWRSKTYRERAERLREEVIPEAQMQEFYEIIVVGQFEPGEGYRYIPVPPIHRDRRDALWQREIGARHSTSDIFVFSHDDHKVATDFVEVLYHDYLTLVHPEPWDILVPKRIHALTGAELTNGKADGYMGGHALVMKRGLWAEVPWTSVDTEFWDTTMTRIWREAGGTILYSDTLIHYDIEAAECES